MMAFEDFDSNDEQTKEKVKVSNAVAIEFASQAAGVQILNPNAGGSQAQYSTIGSQ